MGQRQEQATRFVVAPGISTHGERGILDQGKEVTPGDFEGGKTAFDELVKRGVLVPAAAPQPEPEVQPAPQELWPRTETAPEAAKAPEPTPAPEEPAAPQPEPPPAPKPTQESSNARQTRSRIIR